MVTPYRAEPLESAVEFRLEAGGAESNVAAHVASLGRRARWFSRLGADPLGVRILNQLAGRGVDTSAVVVDPGHPTGVYFKDPGRGVHYYRAGSAASRLSASDADGVELDGVRIVHVTGITAALGGDPAAFVDRLIERARDRGVRVSFDVNYRPALWEADVAAVALERLVGACDLVFAGRDEADLLWGTATADDLRARFPRVPELVVKDGALGATAYLGDSAVFVRSERVEVVEEVGAGDAFAGGYLAAALADADVEDRLTAAHARAALVLGTTSDFLSQEQQ